MRIHLLLAALLMVFMASCRSGKLQKKGVNLGENQGTPTAVPPDFVISEVEFNEIRLKSEAAISSSALSQKFPVTFHIRKDSIIWASVTIGLELGRAKITRDSLIFLDRFNRKAYLGTWSELSESSGFDLSYDLLQSVLVGGSLFPIGEEDRIEVDSGVSKLFQVRNGITYESRVDNSVHKIFEVVGQDPRRGSKLELGFSRFITQGEQLVPSVISMLLTGNSDIRLEMTHSRIEWADQPLNFSFSIPGSYKIQKIPGI